MNTITILLLLLVGLAAGFLSGLIGIGGGIIIVPALVIFVFYGVLVNRGVENWFSERVTSVVENSATVFQSYVNEQTSYIGDHITLMATDLNREAGGLQARPAGVNEYLAALASYHAFPAAYLIDGDGRVMAKVEGQDRFFVSHERELLDPWSGAERWKRVAVPDGNSAGMDYLVDCTSQ